MGYDAKILADSISPAGHRLTTFEVTFPRIVLAEFNTHRIFSRNSASSRAIPVEKMVKRVLEDSFQPVSWGKNQKGMQAETEFGAAERDVLDDKWCGFGRQAVDHARELLADGVHKQITNRLLEPWLWHTCVVSATEWGNFFNLRDNGKAQPEIHKAADLMHQLFKASKPRGLMPRQWHLPLVSDERSASPAEPEEFWVKVSAGRCARVSYLTHDGKRDVAEDVRLHDSLLESGHMCFDAKTEVLTSRGWKACPDVVDTDLLFAVDPTTSVGGFERPSALHAYDVDEPMYHVYGRALDLKVTLNHRMLVSARHKDGTWTPFEFDTAANVRGKPRRYLKSARFDGHGDVPAYARTTEFMRLLGFAIGDGYAVDGNQISFHLKKSRKVDFLKSLGFTVRDLKNNKYVVESAQLGSWFRANCYDDNGEKRIPEWAFGCTEAQALALFDGLRNSDGSAKRRTWVYDTTSQQVADTLQAMLHIHGQVGSFSYRTYGDDGRSVRVNVSDRTMPRVEVCQKDRSRTYVEEMVPYRGMVYCATVSTGALMVRRNGHVAISGNSPLEHPARPMNETELELFAKAEKVWVPDAKTWGFTGKRTHFLGNFNGWVQWRKMIPGEADIHTHRGTTA